MKIEQRINLFSILLMGAILFVVLASCNKDECETQTFYQDADGDGLGNQICSN